MKGVIKLTLALLCFGGCAQVIGANFDDAQRAPREGDTIGADGDAGSTSPGSTPNVAGVGGEAAGSGTHSSGEAGKGGSGQDLPTVAGGAGAGTTASCEPQLQLSDARFLPASASGGLSPLLLSYGLAAATPNADASDCIAALLGIDVVLAVGCDAVNTIRYDFPDLPDTVEVASPARVLQRGPGFSLVLLNGGLAFARTRQPLEARAPRVGETLTVILPQGGGDALADRIVAPDGLFDGSVQEDEPRAGKGAAVFGAEGKLLGFCSINECQRLERCRLLSEMLESSDVLRTYYSRRNALLADATGDGLTDAIVVNYNAVVLTQNVTTYGPHLESRQTWSENPGRDTRQLLAVDVDGDPQSTADLVLLRDDAVDVQLSSGKAFGATLTWLDAPFYGEGGTLAGRLDDDAKIDLVIVREGAAFVRRSTGSSFGELELWAEGLGSNLDEVHLADVSGDGLADLVLVRGTSIDVLTSTGGAFDDAETWLTDAKPGFSGFDLADVTGDGAVDVIALEANYLRLFKSSGSSFVRVLDPLGANIPIGERANYFVDVDGDGAADAVAHNELSIVANLSKPQGFSAPVTWLDDRFYGGL
jgi:hypothetical protein